jgi:hypothetical protein
LATSQKARNLIVNIIHEDDIVSRLSLISLVTLKSLILDLFLAYCRYQELNPLHVPRKWTLLRTLGDAQPDIQLEKFFDSHFFRSRTQIKVDASSGQHAFFLPGRIFHLSRNKDIRKTLFSRSGLLYLNERHQNDFQEILLSRHVLIDHFPQTYYSAAQSLEKQVTM